MALLGSLLAVVVFLFSFGLFSSLLFSVGSWFLFRSCSLLQLYRPVAYE